jgi:hypothetical protein
MLPDGALRAMMALGVLTTTLSLLAAPSPAQAATPTTKAAPASSVGLTLADRSLRYGERVVARGTIGGGRSGLPVVLEHRTRAGAWRVVARGATRERGAFRLLARIPRSGMLRVLVPTAGGAVAGAAPASAVSRVRGVRVTATVTVGARERSVRLGRSAAVRGRVRPGTAGRLVVLERRSGRRWTRVARTRTGSGGAFTLRFRARSSFSAPVRVRTAGAPALAPGRARAGRLSVLRPSLASWYGEGQRLACGGALTPGMMGVAHKTLPCGTMVTIRHRGRQVRVPVVDRGPYVGGREWDLGPGVRAALGFDGVGTVWVAH